MAQKREKKDETLELKVQTEAPLSLSACPDNCKITGNPNLGGPDPARIDPGNSEKAEPSMPRSEKLRSEREDPATSTPEKKQSDAAPAKKAVNRCSGCGKRVGLTGFRCRCGDLFCSEHRYSDRHDCSFDYKAAGREAIARENPVVRAAKILKV